MLRISLCLALCCAIFFSISYGQERVIKRAPITHSLLEDGTEWEIIESLTQEDVKGQDLTYNKVPIRMKFPDSLLKREKSSFSVINPDQFLSVQNQNLITIINENFEGSFPGTSWQVTGNPTWGKTTYKKHGGSYSVWCARGGTSGVDPQYNNYPNNCNSGFVYGPFNLSDVNWAGFYFYLWLDSESNYDYFNFLVSKDGTNFYGYGISGSTNSNWIPFGICFRDVPTLGNVTGRSSVWIALVFKSDGSGTMKGAFVDDLIIQKGNLLQLTQMTSFSTQGSYPWGITHDGTNLWQSNYSAARIYKINPLTGSQLNYFSVSGTPTGLAWDGTYLWIADAYNEKIYKRSTTGSLISSFYSPGSQPTGLTWDGTHLWLCDGSSSTIWQLSTTGTIIKSFPAPGSYHAGLGWNGQHLFLADNELLLIYELDTSGNLLDCYLAPSNSPVDLDFEGGDLWIADDYSDRIYKLMGPAIGPKPRASFTISPASGYLETIFTVDASSCRDDVTPTSDLQVKWDWENDWHYDTDFTTTKTATHQYPSVGTWTIKLQVKDGDANVDSTTRSVTISPRAPLSFSLVSPASYDTVWAFMPTFTWRSTTDLDAGDMVNYQLIYSRSSWFSSPDTLFAGHDTTATITDSLQQMTRYYWKVEATDLYGLKTTSSQSWSFLVADLTPPKFTKAILQNPIATEDLDIYAIPDEKLDAEGIKVYANGTPIAMKKLYDAASVWVYGGDYELTASGTLVLIFKGKDAPWKNEGCDTLIIPVQLIKPDIGGIIASVDKKMQITFPENAVSQEIYVTISPMESNEKPDNHLFKQIPVIMEGLEPIGAVYQIGPDQLTLLNPATITFYFSEQDLKGRDRNKLGIYRLEDSNWVPIESYLDDDKNQIIAPIDRLGELRLCWNQDGAESVMDLPETYQLFQNYPNPFNSSTILRYALPAGFFGQVKLVIYNSNGQIVKTLLNKVQGMGHYAVEWDGTDHLGNMVTSGIYFSRLATEKFHATHKMILIR